MRKPCLPVLGIRFRPLQRVLGPDALRVNEFRFPGLNVAVEVRNQLILLMTQAGSEVRDANVDLLRPAQVRLGNEDVAHRQHAEATQLLRRVENYWRKASRHLGIEPDFDARLNFVFALYQQIQQLVRVDSRLPGEETQEQMQRKLQLINNSNSLKMVEE